LKRSQDFKDSFHDAGQFCWGTYEGWHNHKVTFDKNSSIYLMSTLKAQDIDNIEDWKIAEYKYKYLQKKI
jgi:N-acylneuraminate cytidylyltransferase